MKNFIFSFFIASFALASFAMDKYESPKKDPMAIISPDRIVIPNIPLKTADDLTADYLKHVDSLLECTSIFDLTETHFTFFRHVRKNFPELFNRLNIDNMTALHNAVVMGNYIAINFLLALDVSYNIPALMEMESENEEFEEATAEDVMRDLKVNSFIYHFSKGPWAQRRSTFNARNLVVWQGDIFLHATGRVHLAEILDILVNCPNGEGHTKAPALEMYFLHPTIKKSSIDIRVVDLLINAGSVCNVENLNENTFQDMLNQDSTWNLILDKGLASKNAMERVIRAIAEHALNSGAPDLSRLETLLSKTKGKADINAAHNQRNALLIAFQGVKPHCYLMMEEFDNATQLAHLLLDYGADPHYALSGTKNEASGLRNSPIIQLLENSNFNRDNNSNAHIRFDEALLGLLEHCKKVNFILEDFKQWAERSIRWILQPQLCKFLIENGIDPLMNLSIIESYPLKYALDTLSDPAKLETRSMPVNEVHSAKIDSPLNKAALESIQLMLPYCSERLASNPITLSKSQASYLRDKGKIDIFLKNNFILPN